MNSKIDRKLSLRELAQRNVTLAQTRERQQRVEQEYERLWNELQEIQDREWSQRVEQEYERLCREAGIEDETSDEH